jgi:hypothetical protein
MDHRSTYNFLEIHSVVSDFRNTCEYLLFLKLCQPIGLCNWNIIRVNVFNVNPENLGTPITLL